MDSNCCYTQHSPHTGMKKSKEMMFDCMVHIKSILLGAFIAFFGVGVYCLMSKPSVLLCSPLPDGKGMLSLFLTDEATSITNGAHTSMENIKSIGGMYSGSDNKQERNVVEDIYANDNVTKIGAFKMVYEK